MDKKHQILVKFPPIYLYRKKRATADHQISITFSLGKISSFPKKRQFNNKKYIHTNKTCQNDPGPPLLPLKWFKFPKIILMKHSKFIFTATVVILKENFGLVGMGWFHHTDTTNC